MRYMNAPARAAFGYEEGAYAGRKCYQVLQGFSQPCVFCQNHLPSEQGFKTWENQNVRLHRRFLIRDKIIQWDGRPARLEIYQAPAAQEEARENAEHVLLEMAGLLLSAESLEDGIQGTLERLGGFYGADRCYVVQARLGERTFQAAQQWQSPALQARGNAAAQTLEGAGWLEHLKARHLVACHDVEQLGQLEQQVEKFCAYQSPRTPKRKACSVRPGLSPRALSRWWKYSHAAAAPSRVSRLYVGKRVPPRFQ